MSEEVMEQDELLSPKLQRVRQMARIIKDNLDKSPIGIAELTEQRYPIMFEEEAELDGFMLRHGWLTPFEAEQLKKKLNKTQTKLMNFGMNYKKMLLKAKKQVAYDLFEEIICPMCYRLNPQHADMDNGKGCHYCQEREDWQALKEEK